MKKNIFFTFLFLSTLTQAQTFKAPDIVVDTKLNYDWSGFIVAKFQGLVKEYKLNDPFRGSFPGRTLVNETVIGPLLPLESKELISDFGNAIGLRTVDSETKVWIEDFQYEVKGFRSQLKASEKEADGLVIGTDFSASEISLSANKISLSLVIPGNNNSPIFNVDIERPFIKASEEKLINFFAKIKVNDHKDFIDFNLLDANFDQMAEGLISKADQIELNYERIVIPAVSLRVGSKVVNFSQERIERLIREKHQAIKGLLLAQAADFLRSNTTKSALKILEQYKLQKEFWLASTDLKSQFKLGALSTSNGGENIKVDLPADFCTNKKFIQLKQSCINSKETKIAPSRLSPQLHKKSLSMISNLMTEKGVEVVASVSEDYLNKLLVTTYDAGLWKDALEESGIQLGANKVVLRMDKRGESGTLVLDFVYLPTKAEKFLLGSRLIRFPLAIDVGLRIEKHHEEPVIIVRFNDVDTSDDTLINGLPKLKFVSTLNDVPRFKRKVLSSIRERLVDLKNKDVIELRYPELKGFGLENVDFFSDGLGRMNATLSLEDIIK
jgi:hypothetical protein